MSWNLEPYVGNFADPDNDLKLEICLKDGVLILSVCGTQDTAYALKPYNFSSALFPRDLFPIGELWCLAGKRAVTFANFEQENGNIVKVSWAMDSNIGRRIFHRTHCVQAPPLPQPHFLTLPGEIRNLIYEHILPRGDLHLFEQSDGMICLPAGHFNNEQVEINPLQHFCRQLKEETRDREASMNVLHSPDSVFLKLMSSDEHLLFSNMRTVVINEFENLLRFPRSDKLFLFAKFCFEHQQININIIIEDFHYGSSHTMPDFLHTGWILKDVFRGETRAVNVKMNRKLRNVWEAGHNLAELNAPNLKLYPTAPGDAEGFQEGDIRARVDRLFKVNSRKMKAIMGLYHNDRNVLLQDVKRWYEMGI